MQTIDIPIPMQRGRARAVRRALSIALMLLTGAAIGGSIPLQLSDCPTNAPPALGAGPRPLQVAFPAETVSYLHTTVSNWVLFSELDLRIALPQDAPTNTQALVHLRDRDGLWFQQLLPGYLQSGSTNTLRADWSAQAQGWRPVRHHGTWHYRARLDPMEVGLHLFARTAFTGEVQVVSAHGVIPDTPAPAPEIRLVRPNRRTVPLYECFELRFACPDRYANPFDPRTVDVSATFIDPSGLSNTVHGFYYQDHARFRNVVKENTLPQGPPEWRVRFAPRKTGTYSYRLHIRDRFGVATWGPATFTATPSDHPGYVRVSPRDRRCFEFDDQSPYFPIGHNIRSPYDARMDTQFPWRFRHPEGSLAYDRYFRDMAAHGENMAEIWASAWSLGLEWSGAQPGYHGVGDYHMRHAWELDHVMELARKHDILINLVISNHGRLSSYCDPEWELNPYHVEQGGYLRDPMAWFSHPRAKRDFRQLMRYMIARWGWSRHLFAWELWSELDLCGASNQAPRPHRDPKVMQWLREMGQYVRDTDPYDHLISAHVSGDYTNQGEAMTRLPLQELCPIDAYHSSSDPLNIVDLLRRSAAHNAPFNKPVLVTEFGGSPMAANLPHLKRELHAALWASTATGLAGTPLFWWWKVIEEDQLYPEYRALAAYMAGEDRRDPELKDTYLKLEGQAAADCGSTCLLSPTQGFGWVFHRPAFTREHTGPVPVKGLKVRTRGVSGAIYRVQVWDTAAGKPIKSLDIRAQRGELVFELPAFTSDVAFKLKQTVPPTE